MFQRAVRLAKSNSFFLFGPRGSGKSTLVKSHFGVDAHFIDLLDHKSERRYFNDPDLLLSDVAARKEKWIVIDEVQKIPKLLDIVHKSIETQKKKFALTGSSARKFKRGGANLLAGRAFLYHLYPLTADELRLAFKLDDILAWGSLPKIFQLSSALEKSEFLMSYVRTYLKEEILEEQVVRQIDGFRGFLDVAAQMNGKALNFSRIGRDCGVDSKTVQAFYQVLEDTLIGFWLPGFHRSVRKAQKMQPKFFFFDLGIQRALEGSLESPPVPGTSMYGQYFESFLINEIFRANEYSRKHFRLSHYQTSTDQEIDLILSKGMKHILVEIKSTSRIDRVEVEKMDRISQGFGAAEKFFLSQDPTESTIGKVRCLHWRDFISEIFGVVKMKSES